MKKYKSAVEHDNELNYTKKYDSAKRSCKTFEMLLETCCFQEHFGL